MVCRHVKLDCWGIGVFATIVLVLGIGAAVAIGAGESTGTNTACATAPDHTVGVDGTAVNTITGTTVCHTVTYTIPTVTTTVTSGGGGAQPFGAAANAHPGGGAWTSVFDDEFNGTTLDTSKWSNLCNQAYSFNGVSDTCGNVTESAGTLNLALPGNGTGGAVSTDKYPGCGPIDGCTSTPVAPAPVCDGCYVEAYVFFPGSGSGQSVANWPAAWTDGSNWPQNGEVDYAEGNSCGAGKLTGNYNGVLHPTDTTNNVGSLGWGNCSLTGNWSGAWHVFGAYRTSTSVAYYWDGVLKYTLSGFHDNGGAQALVFNSGAGGPNTLTGSAATVKVDWVRVWS